MKITDDRARDILNYLDDQGENFALPYQKRMALLRGAAALVRELDAAEQSAWHAGLDAGREQGRRNRLAEAATHKRELDSAGAFHFSDNGDDIEARIAQQPAAVGVEGLPRYGFPDGNEPRPVPCADGYWTPWHLVQHPEAVEAKDAEIETLKADVAAQRTRADAMAGEAIKHEDRAERLVEALRMVAALKERESDELGDAVGIARDALAGEQEMDNG